LAKLEADQVTRAQAAAEADDRAAREKATAEAAAEAARAKVAAEAAVEAARIKAVAEAEAKAAREKAAAEAAEKAERIRAASAAAAQAKRDQAAAEKAANAERTRVAAEAKAKAEREKAEAEAEQLAARQKAAAEAEERTARVKAAKEADAKAAREKAAADEAAAAARDNAEAERAEAELAASELPPAPPVPEDIQHALRKKGHALLIGVSHYTGGYDQLPNVAKDLQDLKKGLDPYFQDVEVLPSPTVDELTSKLKAFLLETYSKPGERLFIYYSGHGFPDYDEAKRLNVGYITGSDTPVHKDGEPVVNALSFEEIDFWNKQTRARHVLMVFDSCFSGSVFETKGTSEPPALDFPSIRRMLGMSIRYYITAGRGHEEVAADSTFAKSLLNGLRGGADPVHNGFFSAVELGNYLRTAVHRLSDRQTPQFASIAFEPLSKGQFFFLTEPAVAGTSTPLAPTDMTPTGTTAGRID
jgi:hypothetical protein